MKGFRFFAIVAGVLAACCALSSSPARAAGEFCPAEIGERHAFGSPAGIVSLYVRAQSARKVSGSAVIEGKNGWYSFDFKDVAIAPDEAHFSADAVTFTRMEYHSKPLYVHLPAGESIVRAWVADASATGDTVFGWDKQGDVQCDPPTATGNAATIAKRTNPVGDLDVPPGPSDTIVVPQTIAQPAGYSACARPFSPAFVVHAAQPEFPQGLTLAVPITTLVAVAVNADGGLASAWIYQPSGSRQADRAALEAAEASRYRAGTALCAPAPGIYMFRVTFAPH